MSLLTVADPVQASKDSRRSVKRVKFSRSTNGCLACRQQKVKCDETQPICLRCVAGQKNCEYPQKARKSSTPTSEQGRKSSEDTRPLTSGSTDVVSTAHEETLASASEPQTTTNTMQSLDATALEFNSLPISPVDRFASLGRDVTAGWSDMGEGDWGTEAMPTSFPDLPLSSGDKASNSVSPRYACCIALLV